MEENKCQFVSSRGLLKSCYHFNQNIYSSCQISTINPSLVKPGDIIYVCNYALNHFTFVILPKIQVPFVLVSGDSDNEILNSFMQASHLILSSPKVLHWFCQNLVSDSGDKSLNPKRLNPKVTPMPIGMDYHTMSQNVSGWGPRMTPKAQEDEILELIKTRSKPLSERQCKIYSTFHFELSRGDRREAYEHIPKDLIDYENGKVSRRETHIRQMDYAFVASPYGGGPDCHRTWEALVLGCIPIIKRGKIDALFENDEYTLPVLLVEKWSDVTEELLKETIQKFSKYEPFHSLPELSLKYWVNKFEKVSRLVKN